MVAAAAGGIPPRAPAIMAGARAARGVMVAPPVGVVVTIWERRAIAALREVPVEPMRRSTRMTAMLPRMSVTLPPAPGMRPLVEVAPVPCRMPGLMTELAPVPCGVVALHVVTLHVIRPRLVIGMARPVIRSRGCRRQHRGKRRRRNKSGYELHR